MDARGAESVTDHSVRSGHKNDYAESQGLIRAKAVRRRQIETKNLRDCREPTAAPKPTIHETGKRTNMERGMA